MTRRKSKLIKTRPLRCKGGCKEFTTPVQTEKGVKRTCKVCGESITEVGRNFDITPVKDWNKVKRERYHRGKESFLKK